MYVFKEPPPLYQQRNRALTIYKTSVLSPDGTYLLVGCLGGLGRSLTKWMMERGAKHFAFISRSGADKPEAARIVAGIEKFKGTSAKVYRADASDEEAVQRIVLSLQEERPIRGVVHAAMVLKVRCLFIFLGLSSFSDQMWPRNNTNKLIFRMVCSSRWIMSPSRPPSRPRCAAHSACTGRWAASSSTSSS